MSKVYVFTRYGGPEHQELIDRPVPEPAAGELAVEVRAAGVNPFDWKLRSGRFGRDRPLPRPMGQEVAGVVTAVGEGVSGFAVGDAVLGGTARGTGGLAQHTLVRARGAVGKPEAVSFAAAATLPVAGSTAYDLTHQVDLADGQTVLVLGAGGGVGLMATQLARVRGLRVIGIAGAAKRELVESAGALFAPSGDDVVDRVREIAPDGVHLVIDLVGGAALRRVAPLATEPSRVVSAADDSVTELGGQTRLADPEATAKLADLVGRGLVDPQVTHRFPLERAGEAIAVVEGGHATGKVVVEPSRP